VKITEIEALVLLAGEIDISRADGTQDAFLVLVHTDEGLVGFGAGDTSPYVAREIVTTPSSHAIARGRRDVLIGQDPLMEVTAVGEQEPYEWPDARGLRPRRGESSSLAPARNELSRRSRTKTAPGSRGAGRPVTRRGSGSTTHRSHLTSLQ
jgi:hypothetical protein